MWHSPKPGAAGQKTPKGLWSPKPGISPLSKFRNINSLQPLRFREDQLLRVSVVCMSEQFEMAEKYGMCQEAWVVHQESCACGYICMYETDSLDRVCVRGRQTDISRVAWVGVVLVARSCPCLAPKQGLLLRKFSSFASPRLRVTSREQQGGGRAAGSLAELGNQRPVWEWAQECLPYSVVLPQSCTSWLVSPPVSTTQS